MIETSLTIEEAVRCLPDLVERIHANGEAAILMKSGRPIARIVPIPCQGKVTEDLIAFLRGWRIKHPEPDEQFAVAIEASRSGFHSPRDPWE
jgi:antitoxin (DNA-binding transcriptional repressor) of toxin-antitoxin stability system